jgi:hypothetical protein
MQVRVWVLGFVQQEGKTKGWAYLVVLAAGEWPEEDLGTWRREAATAPGVGRQRRQPSRRREREGGGAEEESAHAGGRKRNVRDAQVLQLKLQLQHASVQADRGPCRR